MNDSTWPDVAILDRHGVPTQCLDGQPWFGWGAHRQYSEQHCEIFARVAAQGLRRFVIDTTCSEDIYHPAIRFWRGPAEFDGAPQDRYFRRLAEICPAALFQLHVYVGAPPWWLARPAVTCSQPSAAR